MRRVRNVIKLIDVSTVGGVKSEKYLIIIAVVDAGSFFATIVALSHRLKKVFKGRKFGRFLKYF